MVAEEAGLNLPAQRGAEALAERAVVRQADSPGVLILHGFRRPIGVTGCGEERKADSRGVAVADK